MNPPLGRADALKFFGALAVTAAVFVADFRTGSELSLSLLYLGPIAFVGWAVGRSAAAAIALASVAGWLSAYFLNARAYSRPGILLWNVAMEAGIYLAMAWAVSGMRRGLDRERDLRGRLELAYQRLDLEDRRVGDLQRSLLPESLPAVEGYEFAVYYATSTRAGGDYYDFLPVGPGRVGVLVADASGHGSSAAVLMAMTRALVHAESPALDPLGLLLRLNRLLAPNLRPSQFVTAAFAVLDPSTGVLELARAGHEPPLVLRGDGSGVEALDQGGGPPLGPFGDARFERAGTRLRPGDSVLLYTDGLPDAMNSAAQPFGVERLMAVLAGGAGLAAGPLRDRVVAAVGEYTAGAALEDDLSFIVLHATSPAALPVR